jgi:glycosyltransferase involved in cell wall biosynthesis
MTIIRKTPTVSVILPTFNRTGLIGRAIKNILSQTYQDFGIIVVDDGSTDNTEKIVKSPDDKRIQYILQRKNKGISIARNKGK